MPVLLSGKEVSLAYELLNALQVIETKWEKQVLYFNADILIGKKIKDSEYLAVIQYLNTSWCFSEFPGDPWKLLCGGAHCRRTLRPVYQSNELKSDAISRFNSMREEQERKQNQNSDRRVILRASLTTNLLTHTHRILPRVIFFVEILLNKSYASSSSQSIIDKALWFLHWVMFIDIDLKNSTVWLLPLA